ncbi:MAG: hypothetical protein RQ760_01635 [Sedimentisphaerales bacterium]|nr:hypothetical protein [Sedimentisphaerales bacterium]
MDDFINLLNLNPDRYVSGIVSKGAEPNSISLGYNIYEANPWNWFIQMDNSGTKPREWDPRMGFINTNFLGIDDTLTVIYQAPWDSTFDDNYGVFCSYDFPLLGPRLRLNLYGGHSEFDISSSSGPIDFLGRGTFYGGMYSIRGYDEYELVADGGMFASGQYEFDLVKYEESNYIDGNEGEQSKPFLRKLAPLVFVDYGRAKIRHPVGTERADEDFFSVGAGALIELGDNFSGAVYYGYPLKSTENTRTGKGRLSAGVMLRW